MMTDTPESVTLVPIDRIEVLNSRDRNMKVFEEIVENIRSIGLKKPITVTEREGADGAPAYLLVCGEGRLNAFRLLGESHIPALVVNVTDEDGRPGRELARQPDRHLSTCAFQLNLGQSLRHRSRDREGQRDIAPFPLTTVLGHINSA